MYLLLYLDHFYKQNTYTGFYINSNYYQQLCLYLKSLSLSLVLQNLVFVTLRSCLRISYIDTSIVNNNY